MRYLKLLLSLFFALLCNISVYGFEVDGIYYYFTSSTSTDLTVEVTYEGYNNYGYYSSYSGAVIIPETVTYEGKTYRVTSIGENAFCKSSSLTSITIPKGVTSVGNQAFYGCTSLKEIIIEGASTTLSLGYASHNTDRHEPGKGLFYDCPLEKVHLGRNLSYTSDKSYGYSPFHNRTMLTSVTIGDSVTSIGSYLFYDCSSLTAITIPEGVTSIGSSAFSGCSSLYKVINNSNLYVCKGSSDNGYVAYYARVVYEKSNLTTIGDFQFQTSYYNIPSLVNYIGEDTEIVLPDSYNGESYKIGNYAFINCSSLNSITISEGVNEIGWDAFYGCVNLTSITIPESVTSIRENAFYGCTNLYKVINKSNLYVCKGSSDNGYVAYYAKVVYKGGELTTVGDFQFHTSDNIHSLVNYIGEDTEIILPDNYNGENYEIGNYAFFDCSSFTSITIPEGVTSIGSYAFSGCNSLNSVTIGSGVLSIGYGAFSAPKKVFWLTNTPPKGYANAGCIQSFNFVPNDQYTSLSSTPEVYPYLSSMFEVDGVKYVPVSPSERTCDAIDCAYNETAAVINISETVSFKGIAMTVRDVMAYAFYRNQFIKEVKVSHGGEILASAFYDCDGIQSVELSNKGDVAFYAFCDCDGILTVKISSQGDIGRQVFDDCDGIQSVELSNEGDIGEMAFYNCDGITNVVASNKGDIKSKAFYDCDGIRSVELSNEGDIGDQAFYDCDGILTATISSQGNIGSQAFYDCYGIKSLNISNIGNVGDDAFNNCVSLESVTLGNMITSLGNHAFCRCRSLQEIVIPDSVKSIGKSCFSGCQALKSAIIGDGLASVEEDAFSGCSGLDSVRIGNGVISINSYAFSHCSSLKTIEFGDSVASIKFGAFKDCSSLSVITIPQTVTTIENNVFSGCSSLADVIIADRTTALALGSNGSSVLFADCPLDSVYIGGKITYNTTSGKGYSPFYRNTSLRTVVITDREEQIYNNEFYGCTNLQDVTIGNGVKSIGDYAFSGCSSLEGFSFGSNMETIGTEAFSDCTSLTSITSHAAVPPTCGAQALDDINKWSCTLRVPSGYAAAYQTADQWKEFFFVEDVVEVAKYKLTFMIDGEVYYTDSLAHKAEVTVPEVPEREGYTFSGWSEIPETMPAEDVTISGFFTVNIYKVYYYVGDELVHTAEVAYGEAIPEYVYEPTAEGDVFVGWVGETYETMPAHDVTYTANIESGIEEIENSKLGIESSAIYDLHGRKIQVDDLRELERGVYIIDNKKVVIK